MGRRQRPNEAGEKDFLHLPVCVCGSSTDGGKYGRFKL